MKDKSPQTIGEAFREFHVAWFRLLEEVENSTRAYRALDWLTRLLRRIPKR